MAIAGGAVQSVKLWLDENGDLKVGSIQHRMASLCMGPDEAIPALKEGKAINLVLYAHNLLDVIKEFTHEAE